MANNALSKDCWCISGGTGNLRFSNIMVFEYILFAFWAFHGECPLLLLCAVTTLKPWICKLIDLEVQNVKPKLFQTQIWKLVNLIFGSSPLKESGVSYEIRPKCGSALRIWWSSGIF